MGLVFDPQHCGVRKHCHVRTLNLKRYFWGYPTAQNSYKCASNGQEMVDGQREARVSATCLWNQTYLWDSADFDITTAVCQSKTQCNSGSFFFATLSLSDTHCTKPPPIPEPSLYLKTVNWDGDPVLIGEVHWSTYKRLKMDHNLTTSILRW